MGTGRLERTTNESEAETHLSHHPLDAGQSGIRAGVENTLSRRPLPAPPDVVNRLSLVTGLLCFSDKAASHFITTS